MYLLLKCHRPVIFILICNTYILNRKHIYVEPQKTVHKLSFYHHHHVLKKLKIFSAHDLLIFLETNFYLNWLSNPEPPTFKASVQTTKPCRIKYQGKLKSLSCCVLWQPYFGDYSFSVTCQRQSPLFLMVIFYWFWKLFLLSEKNLVRVICSLANPLLKLFLVQGSGRRWLLLYFPLYSQQL